MEGGDFEVDGNDIKLIFSDFADEGFKIIVSFKKRLHKFDEEFSKNGKLSFYFKHYISVNLISRDIYADQFSKKEIYSEILKDVKFRLDQFNLYIYDIEVSRLQIEMLIYKKEN